MSGRTTQEFIDRVAGERMINMQTEALDYRPVMNWRGQPASTSAPAPRAKLDISAITAKLMAKLPSAPVPILIERRI